MSGEAFRPRPGCRLVSTWPLDEDLPVGWQRSEGMSPIVIWRIADGGPLDDAVEILGYTDTPDCGITHGQASTRRRRVTARSA